MDDGPDSGEKIKPAGTSGRSSDARGAFTEAEIGFINSLLDRVDRSYQTFKVELWVYRMGCFASLAMVLFAAGRTVYLGKLGTPEIGTFLGSGGLFAVTGERVTRFLRENIGIIKMVLERLMPKGLSND
jgi:hypothetical protein